MKQHPASMLLIEPDNGTGTWKLVERETTRTGLQRGEMPVIASYEMIAQARGHLAKLKQRKKQYVP